MYPLLVLHGALGAASTMAPLAAHLKDGIQLFSPDFRGHGGQPLPEEGFSIARFAREMVKLMDDKGIERAHLFGYSMGGYVALYLARHYPGRVEKVATLATKFDWREETAKKEVALLDPDKIQEKVPRFAEALANRHAPLDWREVMRHTAAMMLDLGRQPELSAADLSAIPHPVMLSAGDQDRTATPEETLATYRLLQNGKLWILPGTPHPLEKVDAKAYARGLLDFLKDA